MSTRSSGDRAPPSGGGSGGSNPPGCVCFKNRIQNIQKRNVCQRYDLNRGFFFLYGDEPKYEFSGYLGTAYNFGMRFAAFLMIYVGGFYETKKVWFINQYFLIGIFDFIFWDKWNEKTREGGRKVRRDGK